MAIDIIPKKVIGGKDMRTCSNCGRELPDGARFCSKCGKPIQEEPKTFVKEEVPCSREVHFQQPNYTNYTLEQRKDGEFTTSPAGINIISIIGFILSFLCLAAVWVYDFALVVFPASLLALVLCTIPKAMKYSNIFSRVGFIIALIVTIIAGISFGIYLNNELYGTSLLY